VNVRLYDGSVRCGEHMDASSHESMTEDACTYCPRELTSERVDQVVASIRSSVRDAYPCDNEAAHGENVKGCFVCAGRRHEDEWNLSLEDALAEAYPENDIEITKGEIVITQQDTEDIFVGSGALSYSWWEDVALKYRVDGSWMLTGTVDGFNFVIDHDRIIETVKVIREDAYGATQTAIDECRLLLEIGPDATDFDADTADQVLQVAAMGMVTFG